MTGRITVFAAGGSTGFGGLALAELVRQVNWGSALAFAGSVVMAAISWYSAARTAKREQDRLDDEQRERRELRAALAQIRLHQLATSTAGAAAPPEAPIKRPAPEAGAAPVVPGP